jgi:hypothetical protein
LNSNDDVVASDHLPVMMVFNNPFTQPFVVTSFARSNENVAFTWQSVPGQSYQVESSSNLTDWTMYVDSLLATNYSHSFTTNEPAPLEFFRVKRLN